MLRYSGFNVLNFKAWNPHPSNSVFEHVYSKWGRFGVRGGKDIGSLLLQIEFHNVVK